MKPLVRSSGDILADRRAEYSEMLSRSGDHAAAAELMAGALELAPAWAVGWFRLGEMHEAAGAWEPAKQAWRMALKLDPADHAGAALKLELLGQGPRSDAPPGAFVEALFDGYAATFEHSLVEKLGYNVPQLMSQALGKFGGRRFCRAVDLGCGTGLMGMQLRAMVDFLEGCDISAAMLKKAEAKGCYDRLVKSDIQSLELPENSVDLIVAADVFIYLGLLDRIFDRIATALVPGGLFCFSVEYHDGPEDFVLRPSRRYAHSQAGLVRLLQSCKFSIVDLERSTIRMDRGQAIEGIYVLAEAGQAAALPAYLEAG